MKKKVQFMPSIIREASIGSKILIAFLGVSLVSLILFGYIALESNESLGNSATQDSENALENLGEEHIKKIAEDVAKELEIYIRDHPDMTVLDLQNDTYFMEFAIQPVGKTGYTATTDSDTLINRFHVSESIVNMDLHTLADSRPGFWSIMERTQGGEEACGYYDWEENDGTVRAKYMHIAIVNATTAAPYCRRSRAVASSLAPPSSRVTEFTMHLPPASLRPASMTSV